MSQKSTLSLGSWIASRLFGTTVKPERVIGETLRRATPAHDLADPAFIERLTARVRSGVGPPKGDSAAFLSDPLSSWIESSLGLRQEPDTGRLVRCKPLSLSGDGGAADSPAELTGLEKGLCQTRIRETLLSGYLCRDENDQPSFAFRLHPVVRRYPTLFGTPAGGAEPTSTPEF